MSRHPHRELSPIEKVIVKILEDTDLRLSPRAIASFSESSDEYVTLNYNTVRTYSAKLARDGIISNPHKGEYCSLRTYGAMNPTLMHDVFYEISAEFLKHRAKIEDEKVRLWDTTIFVQFGSEYGRVTGYIANDNGMNQDAVILAIDKVFSIVKEKTGVKVSEFILTNCHLHKDFVGISLEGLKGRCFTIDSFNTCLDRIYEKNRFKGVPKVRDEIIVDAKDDPYRNAEVLKLFSQPLSTIQDKRVVEKIMAELKGVQTSVLYQNRTIVDQQRQIEGLSSNLEKLIGVLEGVSKGLQSLPKLAESNEKLIEPLTRLANVTEEQYKESKERKRPDWYR